MDWSKGEYDPWIAARMLIKFDVYTRWPTVDELDEWMAGWKTGCAEMAEYERWPQLLHEYTLGRTVPMHLLAYAHP